MADLQLWELLVPCVKNDGTPYRTRHHREWDRQVKKITGGLTIMKPTKGKWVAPTGKTYTDRMIPVRVACYEEDIESIMARTLKHYPDQICILAYKISDDVRFMGQS